MEEKMSSRLTQAEAKKRLLKRLKPLQCPGDGARERGSDLSLIEVGLSK